MKITFFEIKGWEANILKRKLKGKSLQFFREPLTLENVHKAKNSQVISGFLKSKLTPEMFKKLPKLRLIVTRSTGFDHINIRAAKKRKVTICNVPTYGANTVAEHTFALILALSRNTHKSYLRAAHNNFTIEGLKGFDLKGKTIGVVGAGNIGKNVIRIARGFQMKVLAMDRHHDESLATDLSFLYVDLNTLLKKSDIVSLHVPYTKDNHHMINKRTLSKMKRGSILINTARGKLVDTEALIKALESKQIAGAGLDVIEGEKMIKEEKQLVYEPEKFKDLLQLAEDHILLSKDNVIFTPHIAFYSQEALVRIIEETADNILGFIKGDLNENSIVS
jgi:D-lactate dehydrogenase